MNLTQHLRNEVVKNAAHIPLSGATAYNLLAGGITLSNSVVTAGMATTLYTGNGTTQSVVTGVDMATQWGNSASETFGGLVWGKSRSIAYHHQLYDTVRGATKIVYTAATNAEGTEATGLTSFNNNGFTAGLLAGINENLATYASWNFQTTHRITGTTNHGKAYTCHYNPFTGFTMIKYEGSGLAGHEIPHHLGRKLGFVTVKNLSVVGDWEAYTETMDGALNTTGAFTTTNAAHSFTDTMFVCNNGGTLHNNSGSQHIMYGWANSYFDEANTLIGNYEVGVYQGTGAAGNKVTTKGKPAWVMVKRLDSTGNWSIVDNVRGISVGANPFLQPNLSNAEASFDIIDVNSDGFTNPTSNADSNASGGQYLYMVAYDNDAGSGKSKYPRATDTSALSLTATIPFANGVDANGTKNTVLTKNETVAGLTLQLGKNYIWSDNTGAYGVDYHAPRYGNFLTRNYAGESPKVYKPTENLWYNASVGAELVTNPNFATDILNTTFSSFNGSVYVLDATIGVWNSGTTLLTVASGKSFVGFEKTITTVIGKKYRVKCKIDQRSANVALIASTVTHVGTGDYLNGSIGSTTVTTTGEYILEFTANSTTTYLRAVLLSGVAAESFRADSISSFEAVIEPTTPITESRNYLDAIVYADAGGQPTFVEQLPKIEYKKNLEVDTLKVHGGFDLGEKTYVLTSSRFLNATYYNTSGRPKKIMVGAASSASAVTMRLYVDGVNTFNYEVTALATQAGFIYGYIPNGSRYYVTLTGATGLNWVEVY